MSESGIISSESSSLDDNLPDMIDDKSSSTKSDDIQLLSLFWIFLKIGSVAFGGFMTLISVIESSLVKQRKLLSHQEMLDGISLANLLPGPMAVNVVAFAGYRLRGAPGAIVATTAVVLPSFILLLVLSYFYFQYGETAALQDIFRGFIPAVAAVVLSVAWRMGQKTIKGRKELLLVILAATVLSLSPFSLKIYVPPLIIACLAVLGYQFFRNESEADVKTVTAVSLSKSKLALVGILLGSLVLLWFIPLPLANDSVLLLMLTFASMSLMLFGGGYVFIPIIGSVVVLQYGWVTQQEFMDGIALGQVTPGPILISATFIGYKVAGLFGAIAATIAIFAPPAVLMVTASHALDSIRSSAKVQAAMHGIHCGVIGMILVATFVILQSGMPADIHDYSMLWPTAVIFIAALLALFKLKLDVIWVIAASGLIGYVLY